MELIQNDEHLTYATPLNPHADLRKKNPPAVYGGEMHDQKRVLDWAAQEQSPGLHKSQIQCPFYFTLFITY